MSAKAHRFVSRSMPLFALGALIATSGCVSTQEPVRTRTVKQEDRATSSNYVHQIKLTSSVAEVGKPFKGQLVHHDNYIERAEYAVNPVPPGLSFDPATGVLKGVPTEAGFYRLTVAVREQPEQRPHFITPDGRWWTQTTELAIYTPIQE